MKQFFKRGLSLAMSAILIFQTMIYFPVKAANSAEGSGTVALGSSAIAYSQKLTDNGDGNYTLALTVKDDTMDAVADVVGVCLLMEKLSPDQVIVSPVHTGSGQVHCAHGILPVPAPATALILRGIPSYGGAVKGELCTPTGAALLKHFATRFGDRPVMTVEAIGYGMGKKDFEQANCVRAFLGESEGEQETVTKLECNLDDMTGEDIGFAMEQLFAAGAHDVYTQPIGMKKNRPGILLSVICRTEDADSMAGVMMKHTTTLGIRRQDMNRYVLQRNTEVVDTAYGEVRIKHASGLGTEREKPEYEDIATLARKHNESLRVIRDAVQEKRNKRS